MAITLNQGRQYTLHAELTVNLGDTVSGVATTVFNVPPGTIILGLTVVTDTAFNSGTSDTISVGDAGSATRYINANATVLRTAALQQDMAVASKGYRFASSGVIQVTNTAVGTAATTGKYRIYLSYIIEGRANEPQT